MNRKFKRFLAILLSAAMVCGSSVMAFADETPDPEGNVTGDESEVEGYVETDVFTYKVPTASANALKMILDPQKLISQTHAAAYEGYTESDFQSNQTVYFRRYETGASNKFMGESDSLSACNLGTVSMNVTLSTEIENTTGITFVSDNATFASIKTPAIKFTFKTTNLPDEEKVLKDNGTTDKLISSNGAEVKNVATVSAGVVAGVKSAYAMSVNKVNGEKKYTYNIPSANTAAAATAAAEKRIAFSYAAEANNVKGWKDILDANPSIKLTYKFEKWTDDEEDAETQAYLTFEQVGQAQTYYMMLEKSKDTGFGSFTMSDVSSFTINDVDVKASANVSSKGYLAIQWSSVKTALGISSVSDVDKYVAKAVINGVTYKGTYTP